MRLMRLGICGWAMWMAAAGAAAEPLADSAAPLADAVERQEPARVGELIAAGVDVNAAQVDGMTALHWAVHYDDLPMTMRLIAAGAEAQVKNRYGVTPLSLACMNGNGEIVERLLAAGADPQTTLRGGETVLMTAARTGKLKPVEALLARGVDVNARERKGQTAVMWAAAEGQVEVVEILLKRGADFRTPLKSGFTALFFAAREGRIDVARALLAAGADVNQATQVKGGSGKAPNKGTSPLILAVENGHFELAVALLEAGADPNDQRSGYTALHTLTWVRKPNRGDGDDGAPPPEGSGNLGSLEFVRQLVKHGADVNARLKKGNSGRGRLNQTGATPFLMAADTADVPFMRLLIELGADPSIPNVDNSTALMAAAGLGTLAPGEEAGTETEALEAVRLTLELGGDVDAVDANGETAMHGAAYASWPKMAAFLAEQGASVEVWNRKNKYGWTPLLIAQGYRPGNFKPAPETVAAIEHALGGEGREKGTFNFSEER